MGSKSSFPPTVTSTASSTLSPRPAFPQTNESGICASASAGTDTKSLVVGTRLHLGHATSPPETDRLCRTIASFADLVVRVGADHAVVAVNAEPKPGLPNYDLVAEVRRAIASVDGRVEIEVLPISPWGNFVPALNALVSFAASRARAAHLLLVSAETDATAEATDILRGHLDDATTLVAGAALPGHDHRAVDEGEPCVNGVRVELSGRTTPWNTLAVWDVAKLALTGFLLVSDGLHPDADGRDGPGGVEEVSAIAALQAILPPGTAEAKLVRVPGIDWRMQDFSSDDGRREWHERKMKSKVSRASRHLELLGLNGTVIHC